LKTEDLNKDLKDHFDFSNYPKENKLYDVSKKKVPGYFKDELAGEKMIRVHSIKKQNVCLQN
jgi:hypothetical protein